MEGLDMSGTDIFLFSIYLVLLFFGILIADKLSDILKELRTIKKEITRYD